MAPKAKVFKMAGSWIWMCEDHEVEPFSADFPSGTWRNPWDACLSSAHSHAVRCHADTAEVIEP